MNKNIVQRIVNAYNDYYKNESIHILVETSSRIYNCYDAIGYGEKYVTFMDEDSEIVVLEYKDVVGVKVRDI